MEKWKLVITVALMIICFGSTMAQDEVVFHVAGKKNIRLVPAVDTLLTNKTYSFRLYGISIDSITGIECAEAKVVRTDSGIAIRTPSKAPAKKCFVRLYVTKNKKLTEVLEQGLSIISPAELPAFSVPIAGVPGPVIAYLGPKQLHGEDTVDKKDLNVPYGLYAERFRGPECKVVSFTLKVVCGGKTETFSSKSPQFSPEMKKSIENSAEGCILELSQVQVITMGASGDVSLLGPFKFFPAQWDPKLGIHVT